MRNRLSIAALAATILVGGCGESDPVESNPIDTVNRIYKLPRGATNHRDRGNDWHTFDLDIDGETHSFLHKWSHGESNWGRETITEIHRPCHSIPNAPSTPPGAAPIVL